MEIFPVTCYDISRADKGARKKRFDSCWNSVFLLHPYPNYLSAIPQLNLNSKLPGFSHIMYF